MEEIKLANKSIEIKIYQENKPWSQAHIHQHKLEPILETKRQFCWFLWWQRLSFRWWFLSPNRLFGLSNTCVTHGSSFVDDLWVCRCYLRCRIQPHPWKQFVNDLWGHRDYLRCRIHVSPVEAVSLMISESLMAVWAIESMRHPWEQFLWWFLSP